MVGRIMTEDQWDDEQEYLEGRDVTHAGGPVYMLGSGWGPPHASRMSGPVDMEGKPVTRTKTSHPYSYDAFVLIRFRPNVKGQAGVYTDRMQSWDDVAWRRACAAIDGRGNFSNLSAADWREFFAAYYPGKGYDIVAIEESCNQATGYPVWCVIFTEPAEE